MKKSLNILIHHGFQGKDLLLYSIIHSTQWKLNIQIEWKQITTQYLNGQVNFVDPTDFVDAVDAQKTSAKYKILGIHFDIR